MENETDSWNLEAKRAIYTDEHHLPSTHRPSDWHMEKSQESPICCWWPGKSLTFGVFPRFDYSSNAIPHSPFFPIPFQLSGDFTRPRWPNSWSHLTPILWRNPGLGQAPLLRLRGTPWGLCGLLEFFFKKKIKFMLKLCTVYFIAFINLSCSIMWRLMYLLYNIKSLLCFNAFYLN